MTNGNVYSSGQAWGQGEGQDGFSYSNLNGNNFGYGVLSGGSDSYNNGDRTVSVSEMRSNPY